MTERFAQKQYVYPRRIYEGLEFFLDMDTIAKQVSWISQDFQIDFPKLASLYCPDGSTYISGASKDIDEQLRKLWGLFDLPMPEGLIQMKIQSLALFSMLLTTQEIPPSQTCTFFTETQVSIAKQVEKIITADLRQHHPVWELAQEFSISETSLKNYFRGIYGQNLSAYLWEIRMKEAARLLTSTRLSVAEVAEQVGYINQSKFAAVFKKEWGMAPLEYRRSHHLKEHSDRL